MGLLRTSGCDMVPDEEERKKGEGEELRVKGEE
jgi:hypothetical protein